MTELEVMHQEEAEKLMEECEDYVFCPRCHELLTPKHREGNCFQTYIYNTAAQRAIIRRRKQQ